LTVEICPANAVFRRDGSREARPAGYDFLLIAATKTVAVLEILSWPLHFRISASFTPIGARRHGSAGQRPQFGLVGWLAEAATPVGDTKVFLDNLLIGSQPTLGGFDFPIGVPEFYGQATGFGGFSEALAEFGSGPWSAFYEVAEVPDQISLHRPFYPMRASSVVRQSHLIGALGASS